MANEISKLNNDRVTKRKKGEDIILYKFPNARIRVNKRNDTVEYIEGIDPDREPVNFADLDENFNTNNAEEYVDYLAENNFFFDNTNGGGGGAAAVTLDSFFAETTVTQSPTYTRLLGWVDVEFATSSSANDTFEILPDNKTFLNKKETKIQLSAKLKFTRINNNNNRSTPEIRIVRSTDGGLSFTPLTFTEANAYIRNSNINIEKGTPTIPAFSVNLHIDTQFRLQARTTGENDSTQEQHQHGYFNMLALTQEAEIFQTAPQILNPLPLNLTIPASELFTYNLQIVNANQVTLENAPPSASIDVNGILTIQSPVEAAYPSFKVVAINAADSVESTSNLTIAGFQNLLRVQLNGNDQFMRTDDTSSLDLQRSQSNSISFWIEFTGANINPILAKYDFSIEKGYWLQMDIDKRLRWKFSGNGTFFNEVKWDTVFALNTRYQICISWQGNDATDIELFVNGILQTQRTVFSNTLSTSGDPRNGERLEIGHNPDNGQVGDFIIDELCIWKGFKVLPTQAPELYNNGIPLNMYDFTGNQSQNWWRMGEGSIIPIINNEKSTAASRTMIMVNADNNIIDF